MNKKIKSIIIKCFGTQADFATSLGEKEARVSRVIRGREDLTPERAQRWAKALGCNVEDLIEPKRG